MELGFEGVGDGRKNDDDARRRLGGGAFNASFDAGEHGAEMTEFGSAYRQQQQPASHLGFEGYDGHASPPPPPPPLPAVLPPIGGSTNDRLLPTNHVADFSDTGQSSYASITPETGRRSVSGMTPVEDGRDDYAGDVDEDAETASVSIASPETSTTIGSSLFFDDGKRRIDYVLVYEEKDSDVGDEDAEKCHQRRKTFETALEEEFGLELEKVKSSSSSSSSESKIFVKIHAPWELLCLRAEMVHLKMPIVSSESSVDEDSFFLRSFSASFWEKLTYLLRVDPSVVPEEPDYYTCAFNRSRHDIFKMESIDSFFSSAQRSALAYEVLARAPYEEHNREHKLGIEQLLKKGVYLAAYPLHDGQPYLEDESFLTLKHKSISIPDRQRLYYSWGNISQFYKFQPLHLVRGYFGEKIAIYFAWLGFYTSFLLPLAILGLIVTIYGAVTIGDDKPTTEVCDENGTVGKVIMCPQCRHPHCDYWPLTMSCSYMKITFLVDNQISFLFAFITCIWSIFFLEFWKRRQATLAFDWDLNDELKDEGGSDIRPDFEAKCTRKKKNPITGMEEPYFPTAARIPRYMTGLMIGLVAIFCVLIAVVGVIAYRVAIRSVVWQWKRAKEYSIISDDIGSKVFISVSSATINLICIMLLSRLYAWLALRLTQLENQRTDEDYENSYTLKMYCFQFVNYYSSIFYVAFFKGRFFELFDNRESHGRDSPAKYDECDPAGCLIELFIQMAIIMVGKQIYSNIQEFLMPRIWRWWRKRVVKKNEVDVETEEEEVRQRQFRPQWENDYNLTAIGDLGLFYEYLEMVIQFGFVTLFVVAFPLAPVFALINNLIEIRLDSNKFTSSFRRQRPMRAKDIGVWYNILVSISRFAVITNALVIAFTSNFIDRIFYVVTQSTDGSLDGFTLFTLSQFNISDFSNSTRPEHAFPSSFSNSSSAVCYYRDYRDSLYDRTRTWYHLMLAKVVFVLAFEHVVYFLRDAVAWIVPDTPADVRINVRRETYLGKKALYAKELEMDKELRRRRTIEEREEKGEM